MAVRWLHGHLQVQPNEPVYVDVDVDHNKSPGFAGRLLRLACKQKMDFAAPNSKGQEAKSLQTRAVDKNKNSIAHFAVHDLSGRCARPGPCAELAVAGAAAKD